MAETGSNKMAIDTTEFEGRIYEESIGETAASGARPMRDNAYKVLLIRAMVNKAFTELSISS